MADAPEFEIGDPRPSASYVGITFAAIASTGLFAFFWMMSRRYNSQHLKNRTQKVLHAAWLAIPPTVTLTSFVFILVWFTNLVDKQSYDILVLTLIVASMLLLYFVTKFDAKITLRHLPLVIALVFLLASSLVAIHMGVTAQQKSELVLSNAEILNMEEVNKNTVLFNIQYPNQGGMTCISDVKMRCKNYIGEVKEGEKLSDFKMDSVLSTVATSFACNEYYYYSGSYYVGGDDDGGNGDDAANNNADDDAAWEGDNDNRALEGPSILNILVHPQSCYVAWYTTKNAGVNWKSERGAIIFFGVSAFLAGSLLGLWYFLLKRFGFDKDGKAGNVLVSAGQTACNSENVDDAWTYYSADSIASGNSSIPTKASRTLAGTLLTNREEKDEEKAIIPPDIVSFDSTDDPLKRTTGPTIGLVPKALDAGADEALLPPSTTAPGPNEALILIPSPSSASQGLEVRTSSEPATSVAAAPTPDTTVSTKPAAAGHASRQPMPPATTTVASPTPTIASTPPIDEKRKNIGLVKKDSFFKRGLFGRTASSASKQSTTSAATTTSARTRSLPQPLMYGPPGQAKQG